MSIGKELILPDETNFDDLKNLDHLSVSTILSLKFCPRRVFLEKFTDAPKGVTYPLLAGTVLHAFLAEMELKGKEFHRRFYYKSKDAAVRAFSYHWWHHLDSAKVGDPRSGQLILPNRGSDFNYLKLGQSIIEKYWDNNLNVAPPLEVESKYEIRSNKGIKIVGIMDQIRTVPLDAIERLRPDLIRDGRLHPDFDPVYIVDLKSNRRSYGLPNFSRFYNPDQKDEYMARRQFSLHMNLQATMYECLYRSLKGKWPVFFGWYHLRTGMIYPTYRDQRDLSDLEENVDFAQAVLNQRLFAPTPGENCYNCPVFRPCRGPRNMLVTKGFEPETLGVNLYQDPNYFEPLKLKLRKNRLQKRLLEAEKIKREDPHFDTQPSQVVEVLGHYYDPGAIDVTPPSEG